MKETVLKDGCVTVYQLPTPRVVKNLVMESEGVCGIKCLKYKHPFPYRYIYML